VSTPTADETPSFETHTLFADEHIDELIEDAEQAVAPLIARMNALAVELSSAITECHHARAAIGQMLILAGLRPHPNAVTRLQTDEIARALGAFTLAGGQSEVRLDRRFVPGLVARDEADLEPADTVNAA
jgi:hypothetical protein